MILVSRSGDVKLSARHQLRIAGPNLQLETDHLHVRSGIHYHDSEPTQTRVKNPENGLNALDGPSLKAYNLISVDGIIMGS